MFFFKVFKSLNFRQVLSLMGWFFKHPLFMISTVRATLLTFKISQKEFPNIHGKLNKANAFRHALWNALIAKKCMRFSASMDSILAWTKKVTDWHEDFSPNEKLAREMDLHNNQFGRNFFKMNSNLSIDEMSADLIKMLNHSVQIKILDDIQQSTQMVYIED